MKALTLTQPWATAVALGHKKVETRSWRTSYRGPLLIHAAKGFPGYAQQFAKTEEALGRIPSSLPLGAFVCRAVLVDCIPTEDAVVSTLERLYGDYSPGRWAWLLDDITALPEPIGAKGSLGIWDSDASDTAHDEH